MVSNALTEQPSSALWCQRHDTTHHFYSQLDQITDIDPLRFINRALSSDKYVHIASISISMLYANAIRSLEIIWLRWTGKCQFYTTPAKTKLNKPFQVALE